MTKSRSPYVARATATTANETQTNSADSGEASEGFVSGSVATTSSTLLPFTYPELDRLSDALADLLDGGPITIGGYEASSPLAQAEGANNRLLEAPFLALLMARVPFIEGAAPWREVVHKIGTIVTDVRWVEWTKHQNEDAILAVIDRLHTLSAALDAKRLSNLADLLLYRMAERNGSDALIKRLLSRLRHVLGKPVVGVGNDRCLVRCHQHLSRTVLHDDGVPYPMRMGPREAEAGQANGVADTSSLKKDDEGGEERFSIDLRDLVGDIAMAHASASRRP